MTRLFLNPDLDLPALARDYVTNGRVRVPHLLAEDGVEAFYYHLTGRDDWWHLINTADGVLELDRAASAAMSAKRRAALDRDVYARGHEGFQYRYQALRVPDLDDTEDEDDLLAEFARLMSSAPMLAMLRAVTGCTELAFTDGQATAYGPGDFLTGHDDDVPGKDRLAAYVFGMTPRWKPEWGGLLLFHGQNEATVAGHVPRFNMLDLFAVPQRHSVSLVSPSAPGPRYAVTGWLRKAAA